MLLSSSSYGENIGLFKSIPRNKIVSRVLVNRDHKMDRGEMNKRFVSLSRGLELVVGVVVVGQTLVAQHRLGVVPDHGPAREHAASLPARPGLLRQRGHVEHEPGEQEMGHTEI